MNGTAPGSVFGYRRLRIQQIIGAATSAGLGALVGFVALENNKTLWDMWLFLGLFSLGAVAFAWVAFYLGGTTVAVSDAALTEKRPFGRAKSIAWRDLGRVTRFEEEKATDAVAATGTPTITIFDKIDRFADLQRMLLDKSGPDRYVTVARRPRKIPRWTVPALFAALLVGLFAWDWLSRGVVRVTVVDESGARVAGAYVYLVNREDRKKRYENTGSSGIVELRVPAARYEVSVYTRLDHERSEVQVEVKPRATEEIRVTLVRRR
jgi:hypothetical protein